jgi:hypothetical protein
MMIRRLFGLACAGTLAAQTFIQMPDLQFGMFTKNASFGHETVDLEFAIASANRLKPAFVVITARPDQRSGEFPGTQGAGRTTALRINSGDHVRVRCVYRGCGAPLGNDFQPASLAGGCEREVPGNAMSGNATLFARQETCRMVDPLLKATPVHESGEGV